MSSLLFLLYFALVPCSRGYKGRDSRQKLSQRFFALFFLVSFVQYGCGDCKPKPQPKSKETFFPKVPDTCQSSEQVLHPCIIQPWRLQPLHAYWLPQVPQRFISICGFGASLSQSSFPFLHSSLYILYVLLFQMNVFQYLAWNYPDHLRFPRVSLSDGTSLGQKILWPLCPKQRPEHFSLFISGYSRSSWLHVGFLQSWWPGATLHPGAKASPCGGLSCCTTQAVGHVGFSSCGTWAYLPRGMWDLPWPGIKPMLPALAGGFLTTGPPGKSRIPESFLKHQLACEWMDLLYYQGPWCWRFHWKGCGFWPCYLLLEHVRGWRRACVSFPFEFSMSPWKHCMDCHQINHNVLVLNKKLSWT